MLIREKNDVALSDFFFRQKKHNYYLGQAWFRQLQKLSTKTIAALLMREPKNQMFGTTVPLKCS